MKRKILNISLVCSVVVLFCACSTSKDKWLNRQYHSITAHYNAWWNGNQALKEGIKSLEQNHKDDRDQDSHVVSSSFELWGTACAPGCQGEGILWTDSVRAPPPPRTPPGAGWLHRAGRLSSAPAGVAEMCRGQLVSTLNCPLRRSDRRGRSAGGRPR